MNLHTITDSPAPILSHALAKFEQQFTYPLGTDRFFRIEHSADYAQFYRSIGTARCFIAQRDMQILGVISAALRPLFLPDGSKRQVCYLGDLKVAPRANAGRLLVQFHQAIRDWLVQQPDIAAFGVVMDGARAVPSDYSGRVGIPSFSAVGKTIILRIACEQRTRTIDFFTATEQEVRACYRRLSLGRYASPVGKPEARSLLTPVWLATPDKSACGCLEDTRKAKRLVSNDGSEMISAHLSAFAFSNVYDGAALIQEACARVAQLGYPALFVAVAETDTPTLCAALGKSPVVYAPATVYAHGCAPRLAWNINSSEI